MKIKKIRLQNIKSYTDQEITFQDGVNFISGINGAGKSTVIEALGFALFDFNPGTVGEFIRYGAKSGSITVEFCGDDEREYRVIRKLRKVGTSSQWTVYDLENDSELDLHGAKDVIEWLKEALGVDRDIELDQLFQDVIGVPQGTFIGPFLETPAVRKKKFDSILKVEQYRDAYNNTARSVSILKERLNQKDREKAIKNEQVKNYEIVSEQALEIKRQIDLITEKIARLEEQISLKEKKAGDLDEVKKRIDEADGEIKVLKATGEALAQKKTDLDKNLARALEARNMVQHSEDGYKKYLEIEQELLGLEKKRRTREGLEKEYNRLRQEIVGIYSSIKEREAGHSRLRQEITAEKESITVRMKELSLKTESLQIELEQAKAGQARLSNWKQAEKTIESLVRDLGIICRDIKSNLTQAKEIQNEQNRLKARLNEMESIEKLASTYEEKEKSLARAREEYEVLKSRIQALEKNRKQSEGGLCPFLNSPCLNVEGNLDEYFCSQIEETRNKMQSLSERGQMLKLEFSEAQKARDILITMRAEKERLLDLASSILKLEKDNQRLFDEASKLPVRREAENLIRESGIPFDKKDCLFNDIDSILISLEGFLEQSAEKRHAEEKALLEEINERSDRLARTESDYQNAEKRLKQISIREDELGREEAAVREEAERSRKMQEQADSIKTNLDSYTGLNEELEKARDEQSGCRTDYETYMKYKSEADKTEVLEFDKKRVIDQITENSDQIKRLQSARDQLLSGFNPEEYLKLKDDLDKTRQEHAAEKQILIERRKDYDEHKSLLGVMEITIKEIEVLEKEMAADHRTMNLLNIVRSVLNSAGPPIARIYLENLSREANDLYRQVSRENVILEWREGYDVALMDNFDGRKRERVFRQFSGGEQMTAALAIRLALLKQQSRVNVGFFDEPTANLDSERRMNLAETIPLVTGGFSQIFIISHDDTFDAMTDNVIHLQKDNNDGSHISG